MLFSTHCYIRDSGSKNIKKHLIRMLLFFCFIHSEISVSGNDKDCDKLEIGKRLTYLGLNPTSTTNLELIKDIKLKYQESFYNKVTEEVEHIKYSGIFSTSTLEYIGEIGFKDTFSTGVSYFISPFKSDSNDYGATLFLKSLLPYIYPNFRARMILLSKEQKNAFKMNYNNSFQGDLKLYLSSTGVKRDKIDVVANELFNKLFYKDNYIYFDEEKKLKQIDEQHLIITGLSKPGSDSIFYNGATMSFDEVVELLKESKLPRRMNIDLKHSYAGVGKGKKEITLTVDEVKSAFINGKISELWGPKEESYAYQFAQALYSNSDFTGSVMAYTGKIDSDYKKEGFVRNPNVNHHLLTYQPINSVSIETKNTELRFDSSEMSVKYTKNDFNP